VSHVVSASSIPNAIGTFGIAFILEQPSRVTLRYVKDLHW
jgi:hypothetical protein